MISSVSALPAAFPSQDPSADAGIIVTSVNALAPVGTGTAVLPQNAELEFISPGTADSFAIRRISLGSAQIEVGEGYSLFVNDLDRQLVLENTAISSRTVIFGDARIETASGEALQFWGTTTFAFGTDGKITLETAETADQAGSFLLERIAVSNGPRAVVITGVADEAVDTLTFQNGDGYDADHETRDGFVLEQADDGASWQTEYGDAVTQALLDETAVGGAFGPGSNLLSLGEFSAVISSFLSAIGLSYSNSFMTSILLPETHNDNNRQSSDQKSIERRSIEKLIFEQSFQRHLNLHREGSAARLNA
jgi:Domain of Unknown Function (DUF1521)